jgi:hypothetical protein
MSSPRTHTASIRQNNTTDEAILLKYRYQRSKMAGLDTQRRSDFLSMLLVRTTYTRANIGRILSYLLPPCDCHFLKCLLGDILLHAPRAVDFKETGKSGAGDSALFDPTVVCADTRRIIQMVPPSSCSPHTGLRGASTPRAGQAAQPAALQRLLRHARGQVQVRFHSR